MSTFALKREYALQMPANYVDVNMNEMEYVDGGASISTGAAGLILNGVLAIITPGIFGMIGSVKVWNVFKSTIKSVCQNLSRAIIGSLNTLTKAIGGRGLSAAVSAHVTSNLAWVIEGAISLSPGGIVATALDYIDGSFDGRVTW